MKTVLLIAAVASCLLACTGNESGNSKSESKAGSAQSSIAKKDTTKKSIPSETKKQIGNTDIKINYHAPAVRGRTIWGGLVAYDAVWVTGAHKATSLEVGKDFRVGDKTIPAGKYAIFTIPGKDEWTIIINKNWSQHLADDYSYTDDLVRVKVKPQATQDVVERLKYEIDQRGERLGDINISWEKVRVSFLVEIL